MENITLYYSRYRKNTEFISTNGPIFLPYESQKWAGFYFSNADVDFVNQEIIVDYETGKKIFEPIRRKTEDGVLIDDVKEKEIIENYRYHPFYPIFIKNVEKQETSIVFESIIPAFLLYANENKAFWHNFIKTGEYVLDIVTTFSGIGNLAKFRHLAKLGQAGSLIAKIKLGAGIVEVSSGVANTLLKLTGFEDTATGKSLQEYLFWLELLSLSGEITVAIKNGLQKSAKKLVEKTEDLAKLEKELDHLVEQGQVARKEADDLLDHVHLMAEKTRNTGKYTIQNEGIITLSKFNKIAKRIKEEYGVDMFLIDRNSERWAELYKKWQKKPLQGMWVDQPLISKNYDVPLDGPALYLFKGVTSKGVYEITSYTVQHELLHLKMWNRIKEVYPKNYLSKFHEIPDEIHETFVLSEFVKAKKYTKWSDEDIIADLDALNFNFRRNMSLADFEKFDLEIYLKNLK